MKILSLLILIFSFNTFSHETEQVIVDLTSDSTQSETYDPCAKMGKTSNIIPSDNLFKSPALEGDKIKQNKKATVEGI